MPYQNYVRILTLVCRQPFTQVIPSKVESLVRLVARVDLRVNHVSPGNFVFELRVNVERKRVERIFTPDKSVNVDDKQCPSDVLLIFTTGRGQ